MNDPLPSSIPSLLAARDVHKTYRLGQQPIEVLRGVSLAVRRGEFVALRGASGAGKSTLLHLLGGLDAPSAGEVYFDDRQLSGLSARALAQFRNRQIGFVFQAYHLLPELDALENVSLPARLARVPAGTAAVRARELLVRVGLERRLEHRPAELSGGEQQRVAIARALINAPQVILADEPTGNLDSHTGEGIIDLLCGLQAERQATLIIATHDSRVATRAPRILDLVDGAIATNHRAQPSAPQGAVG
ncbi:MAG: ABC transporter ATP-binding protein [Verrucomicrobia bacterium]|nr:ABC transporter ATP-binding protein [Verrucomicrobiota bacterium]